MVFRGLLQDTRILTNGAAYKKFVRIPQAIALVLANVLWCMLVCSWFAMDGIRPIPRIMVEIGFVVAAWSQIPVIHVFCRNLMIGERAWGWGRNRFRSRMHMLRWIAAIGPQRLEVVISIDNEIMRRKKALEEMSI